MSVLHTIRRAPGHPEWDLLIAMLGEHDEVVLLENAVEALFDPVPGLPMARTLALDVDLGDRGLSPDAEQAIDANGLLDRILHHAAFRAWGMA